MQSMTASEELKIPSFSELPESERTATAELLLRLCHQFKQRCDQLLIQGSLLEKHAAQLEKQVAQRDEQLGLQAEQLGLQTEQIQGLKDEIAILKGEKGRPKIKPSTLTKDKDDESGKGGKGGGQKKRQRGKPERKKTRELEIHKEVYLHPEHIPPGSVFKGYEDYVVQGIEIKPSNTKYRRARYETPEGERLVGELPEWAKGTHFSPELKRYILSQHFELHVTQPLLLKHLWAIGIQLSAGQLARILTERHEPFHEEKDEILRVGLEVSPYVGVDDTGGRHKGKNAVSTQIGSPLFTWFSTTESKSRINFLELLSAGHTDYVIDEIARHYMAEQKLPKVALDLLTEDKVLSDKTSWEAHLGALGVSKERHIRIATEGALFSSIVAHGISPDLVIMSDDAGQFNVTGFLNALCWVHAERTINKIIPYTDDSREALKAVQDKIWDFYQKLKEFKAEPSEEKKPLLQQEFDNIFTQKTPFQTLNLALGRIHDNKKELLLVLERPEIPLHNNLSENDIRDYVKKRKISATTRSEEGRLARDTFLSLKKTCQKLGISFWDYLLDRLALKNEIPPLHVLIRNAAMAP